MPMPLRASALPSIALGCYEGGYGGWALQTYFGIFHDGLDTGPTAVRRLGMEPRHSGRYLFFLEKLRHARHEAKLTQLQVANCLGKPQAYVSKCEKGERRVDFVELEVFAELYGKPITYFVTRDHRGPRRA